MKIINKAGTMIFRIALALSLAGAIGIVPASAQTLSDRGLEKIQILAESEAAGKIAPGARRQALLNRLASGASAASVRLYMRNNGTIRAASGFRSRSYSGPPAIAAEAFLNEYADILNATGRLRWEISATNTIEGASYVRAGNWPRFARGSAT